MKIYVVSLLLLTLSIFSGCATTELNSDGKNVKFIHLSQISALNSCKDLGSITAKSQNNLIHELKNQTARVGGNAVISQLNTTLSTGFLTPIGHTKGRAYNCPPEILVKIHDTEEF